MSDVQPPTAPDVPSGPVRGGLRRHLTRAVRVTLAVIVAAVAAALMLVFTIDLGRFPELKARAERAASNYLERPMHIGRLSAVIAPGVFALDDVVIEGRRPGDRPFFSAGRIYVYVPWWTLFRRELHVEVGLTDWRMTVEQWPDGHSVPKLTPRSSGGRRAPFTTTVRSVYATRGEFVFEDHGAPWGVVAPNLSFALVRADNLQSYVGTAGFSGGTVQIQQFEPMRADLSTRFTLDGPRVALHHIDLVTDGARSHVNGNVDFSKWPEQTYNITSEVDFPRMREIFFANETWRLGGAGVFTGVFRFQRGWRELVGEFESASAVVNGLEFPDLHGSLIWTPERFEVAHADADLLGGHTRFAFSIAPLGRPGGSTHTFTADYEGVDLAGLGQVMDLESLEIDGRATGNIALTWPSGRFGTGKRGRGHTEVRPPDGTEVATADLPSAPRPPAFEPAPFQSRRPLDPIVLSGDVDYEIEPDAWIFSESWAATPHTYVAFSGRLGAGGGASEFPFHVTSHDWQESDRLLARIMSAVAGPTGAVQVGGRGTFDGVMTGSFSAPRIEGRVTGESIRVWDVTWGRAVADVVIAGGYVDITNGRFGDTPESVITANGRFALGFRRDGAEEINAAVTLTGWPMTDLRHAFGLDDWPVDGVLGEAALDLTGRYREMFGSGRVRIDAGTAWGERFEVATGDLSLEGTGMRVHRIEMTKAGGVVRGDASIGWNGTYAFNADGEGIPVESLDNFTLDTAPLTGRLRFTASGAGEFEDPSYTFRGSVDDLFAGDQGIGRVQGQIRVDGDLLLIERLVANSVLLDVDGRGTIALDDRYESSLHLRFTESSFDPYLTFVAPALSPYTRVILSGSVDVTGPLSDPDALTVAATIDDKGATLTMFDYDLTNDGPVTLAFKEGQFAIGQLRLTGTDTNLELTGGADTRERAWGMTARGRASLSILQLVFPAITASGGATLNASLLGSFDAPRLTGEAVVTDGRLRPLASVHGLEAVNGRIRFEEAGVSMDGVTGRMAGGDVTFGGMIVREEYRLIEYNLTAVGRSLRLRYPAGFNSTVNMDLRLLGPLEAPRLTGTVDVLRVTLTGGGDASLLALVTGGTTGAGLPAAPPALVATGDGGVALDIEVTAPRIAFIDTRDARIEGTADLRIGGTFDRPTMTGSIDIIGGEAQIAGNRVFIRESSIDFRNPDAIEPVFDFAADTRVRTPGQTVDITVRITGPPSAFTPSFTSDPALPVTDIISLLVGGTPNLDTAQQRRIGSPQESQQQMMQTTAAFLLASPISSRVGEVFERTLALDTVQITPLLGSEVAFQQLNPSARITLGKRVSARVFLTYSRTLGNAATDDEIILLEYDQNDRVSWVLSRNENRTFALDFRIRYVH